MTDSLPRPTDAEEPSSERRAKGYLASTVKHGGMYAIGTILTKAVGFIMLPVYTRVLTTVDYGILEILALSTDVLGMLVGLGVRQAVLRHYYQYESQEERNGVISTASLLLIAIFGLAGVIGFALAGPLTSILLGPGQSDHFVKLAVAAFALAALGDIPGVYLQARQRSQTFVASNMARLVLALSLNILFVVYLRLGVSGIFLSTIIASIVVGGYMATQMLRETGMRFIGPRARELIMFGAPLMVWQVGSFVLHFSDRYFLRYNRSLAEVGLYALGYKLAMLLGTFVIGPFNGIWSAKSLEIAQREGDGANEILASIMRQYNLALVSVALMLALFSTDVIHLTLGAEFHSADRVVPILVLAVVLFGYRQISQTGAMIARRPGLIAWSTTIAACGAVLLNLLLIPPYGAMGAAVATAAAFGIEFLVMLAFAKRVHPVEVPFGQLARPLALAIVVWAAASIAVPSGASQFAGLAIRAGAALTYFVALAVSGILTPAERVAIVGIMRDPSSLMRALRKA